MGQQKAAARANFYPRPPWGGRHIKRKGEDMQILFLSTPSVGRATAHWEHETRIHKYFYPRPPWGGRLTSSILQGKSIPFLSTPSVGRATVYEAVFKSDSKISIHALRGEGDIGRVLPSEKQQNFYPRPPWGGRLLIFYFFRMCSVFLSTPSVGRATAARRPEGIGRTISIHALRGEGDALHKAGQTAPNDFYPRPPWGGRRPARQTANRYRRISIHALRGEGDGVAKISPSLSPYFYPRPPWGGRLCAKISLDKSEYISIHALRGEGDAGRGSAVLLIVLFLSTPSVGRATRAILRVLSCK